MTPQNAPLWVKKTFVLCYILPMQLVIELALSRKWVDVRMAVTDAVDIVVETWNWREP